MSIRIHELAKKIGMDNKELLSLLKARHFDVKSVSSTIDNISAEAIEQELGKTKPAPSEPAGEAEAAAAQTEEKSAAVATAPEPPPAFTTKVPRDAFVKTADEIRREREEAAKAAAAKISPPPAPVRPAPVAPRPIAPVRAVESVSPPAIKFAPARPPPPPPVPVAKTSPLPVPVRTTPPAPPAAPVPAA